jgi:hypothetical protein
MIAAIALVFLWGFSERIEPKPVVEAETSAIEAQTKEPEEVK